ncbi:hypothetical protein DP117_19770 [Brasilonema sp. UFV-L1]|nr:hypothetical protein [Brasilonema sp. UFV-L1]
MKRSQNPEFRIQNIPTDESGGLESHDIFFIHGFSNAKNSFGAIYEVCLVRFRPIMMMTMAVLMGSVPSSYKSFVKN